MVKSSHDRRIAQCYRDMIHRNPVNNRFRDLMLNNHDQALNIHVPTITVNIQYVDVIRILMLKVLKLLNRKQRMFHKECNQTGHFYMHSLNEKMFKPGTGYGTPYGWGTGYAIFLIEVEVFEIKGLKFTSWIRSKKK